MKRYYFVAILILSVFISLSVSAKSSAADRVSRPGEYAGFSEAIYDDKYELTSQYVQVSDGTKLALDIYRPKDKTTGKVIDTPLPVIWMHTPYNRRHADNQGAMTVETYPGTAARLIKYGYVVATVDFRGLFASYGHNESYNRGEWMTAARMDAYDITEWLARQPWSNGNIGMWGCSATGGSQMQAATTAPPHLKAVFPMSCEYDVYPFRVPGGMAPSKGTRTQAMSSRETRDAVAVPVDADTEKTMLKEAIAGHEGSVDNPGYTPYRNSFAEAITDKSSQPWWLKSSPHSYIDKINSSGIAMYLAANWDEGPTKHGAFFTFNNVTVPSKLIIGPEGHCGWLAVEKNTGFDITIEERRFFDYWLKGINNGIMDEDKVYYYTYNAPEGSEWRSAKKWPLPEEKRVRYYLGEGSLSTEAPANGDQKDEVTVSYNIAPRGQLPVGDLVYKTLPLSKDTQITGHPSINLWVSSTATDGDFIATIQDVGPDNTVKSYNVHGRLRASLRRLNDPPYNNLGLPWHRSYEEDVSYLVPNKPVALEFDILPVSMIIKAGHRIRLLINFADESTPRLDPAPKVTIYRNSQYISYLTLPVIEERSAQSNKVYSGEFVIEPPTLTSLGFEWYIDGDDNRNSAVSARYRVSGAKEWHEALPLLRLQNEELINTYNAFDYTVPNMFAGSIMDLRADTEYEVNLRLTDPDGVEKTGQQQFFIRTRPEPQPYASGRVFHVYPPGFEGKKQEPSFTGLLGAFYTSANGADWFNAYPPRVKPGDTILIHAGIYKDDRYRYANQLGLLFDGTYRFRQGGTADKPIAIKAAGDGEVIFDGNGNHILFDVMASDYLYFEGLTIRNTEVAFQAGYKGLTGAVGLTVKNCRLENIGRGIYTDWSGSKDFYIADNTFIGKSHPGRLEGWIGNVWRDTPGYPTPVISELAVKVYGSGHVIAYNYVANFHDGIDHATYGAPDGNPTPMRERMPVSIDIYNNDITNVDDNCIEADGAMYNIRVLRNRCFNQAHRSLSTQPVFGGPAYFIRNVVYHAPEGGSIKFTANSAGILAYHNTFTAEVLSMGQASNLHYRNNLILGQGAAPEVFSMETATNYSSSDYNGFRPNPGKDFSFIWKSPDYNKVSDYKGKLIDRRFGSLAEYSRDTEQDSHSVLLDYDIFENVQALTTENPGRLYNARDFDFRLKPGAKAIDAGMKLPNINDDYTGSLPDLGAYEFGQEIPHYGPRNLKGEHE